MSTLSLAGVAKNYGSTWALEDVNLDIESGEFVVLLGASGSGKSTLLNIIAGLEVPARGKVILGGRDASDLSPAQRKVAMVFQSCALYPSLSVRRNLSFSLEMKRMRKRDIRDRVEGIARQLQIESLLDRNPYELSGGEKQRVAIGRALVREPSVFLLDEPLSSLDTVLRASLRTELKRLHEQSPGTFVYVTHDALEAMTLATRIAVLDQGRILQFDRPDVIYSRPATSFIGSLIGSPNMNLVAARYSVHDHHVRLHLATRELVLSPFPPGKARCGDDRVIAGFRPEHVQFTSETRPDTFCGRVLSIESTGPDQYSRIMLCDQPITARVPHGLRIERNTLVSFRIDAASISLFSPVNGRRLN